jgi:hypothetical protein
MQRWIVLALAMLSSTAAAESGSTRPPIKIAIVPGLSVGVDAARVDALSQELAEALNAELEVDAIGGLAGSCHRRACRTTASPARRASATSRSGSASPSCCSW